MIARAMPRFLKSADRAPIASDPEIAKRVAEIIAEVRKRGASAVREYSERFDSWSPERFTLSPKEIERATAAVPRELRDHIDRAAEQIALFAKAQRTTLTDLEIEPTPGVVLGHRLVPVTSVGAYSPGGRYPLIASSLMTTVVPKVAGVERVIACAPPISPEGIAPAMVYAMASGGADEILCIGGAQGLAAIAFGIEDQDPVDMVVGAGNAYVAEAKRQLFGTVGIDLLAGPTEILVIADETSDPELIASDIAGQLEHGPTSAGWLISTSAEVAEAALEAIEVRISELPTGEVARQAWERYGEIAICDSEAEAAELADRLAPEHVEIHTEDPHSYLDLLHNYGSIFLGEETTVPYGDKGIGTNHVLPTAGAARYTGGLWVGSFLKALTYQSATVEGTRATAPMIVAICEAEQLPGHARSAQDRLDRISLRS
jgi:sulfopropanediol 3-dehydrogenase